MTQEKGADSSNVKAESFNGSKERGQGIGLLRIEEQEF